MMKKMISMLTKKQNNKKQYEILVLNLETGMTETVITDKDGLTGLVIANMDILKVTEI